ncbi:YfiR family protein [candidate division CSSED10-310 bacterium]|uniref:YfiR family protein n=1 Tax=candidate division CSSED10-310 bacterium TaxID=2855610 RepID=A0ABV6Z3L3_UNCC1
MKKLCLCIMIMAASMINVTAYDPVPDYKIKAALIEKFTRFVIWPFESSTSNQDDPFVIALIGENQLGIYLEEAMAERKIKGRAVVVKKIENLDQVEGCHILFIAQSEKKRLASILARIENEPILTIGSTDGFAQQGVLINFFRSDDTIRFEVNISVVHKSSLHMSAKLLRVARIIK